MSVYNDFRNRDHKFKSIPALRKMMDIMMGTIYVGTGILVLFFDLYERGFTMFKSPFNYIFGGIVLVYGLFRFYRVFSKQS